MGKSKKNKIKKLQPKITFDLEDNAEQLLRAALDDVPDFIDKEEVDISVTKKRHASSKRTSSFYQLDLHGFTLAESQRKIDELFRQLISLQKVRIRIITGKGRHSSDSQNLLARDVHAYVVQKYDSYIVEIEQSPDAVRLGSLPIRGHFEVVLKQK